MRIAICGSINVSHELIKIFKQLKKLGHNVELPYYTRKILKGEISQKDFINAKEKNGDANFRKKASEDLYRRYWRIINESDAIVVVNTDKNNIKNYIGGNTLIEMSFAYIQNKKIYLLNPIPKMTYFDEIRAMKPIVINRDLKKIK